MSRDRIKVPNPFSLISSFLPTKKKDNHVNELDIIDKNKTKNKIKRKGSINFEEELVYLGFVYNSTKNDYISYRYAAIPELFLFWNTEINDISMYYEKKLLSKINFLPNSRVFIEIFIKKTIENLK